MTTTISDQITSTDPAPPRSGAASVLVTPRGCHVDEVLPTACGAWCVLRLCLGRPLSGRFCRTGLGQCPRHWRDGYDGEGRMRLLFFADLHLDSAFAWATPAVARRRRAA